MKGKFSLMWRVTIALVMVLTLGLVMAVPASAATLTSVSATPANATATVTTTYTIGFTTATTYGIKSVDIVFASGFTGTATLVGTPSGIGAGSLTDTSVPSITYTVTDAAVISAGTAITITLSGIVNPAAGTYSVTVTTKDATPAVIDQGTAAVTITPLPALFKVEVGPSPYGTVTAGTAFSVKITALKAGGVTTETGYTGIHLITFTGTLGTGTTPAFELISFTAGVGTSPANFIWTNATETGKVITATDELAVAGTSAAITINPAALASFTITGGTTPVTAGVAQANITVTAKDADGNTVTGYTGTVTWSSTDTSAVLPAAYTFITADAGAHTFLGSGFILKTAGSKTITVTAGTVSKTSIITVNPAAASEIRVTAAPTSIRADNVNASTITATAYDAFGNVDTNFTESATFAASLGDLSGSTNFVAGVAKTTLKSNGVVGTATVRVTPGTLSPYKTVTVTLVAPSLLAEVWVAITGNDANAGTESSPVQTITKGIDIAAPGGTVTVAGGTYTPQAAGVFVIKVNKELTIKAAAGSTPVINAVRDGASAYHVFEIQANNVTIDGFTIVEDNAGVNGDWGIYVAGLYGNFIIQNNTVTGFDNTNDVGIRAMDSLLTETTSGLIKDNTLEANSNGIEVSNCKYVTIQGNLVQNNVADGIALWSGSSDITVIENKVYSNAGGIFASVDSRGIFHQNEIVGNTTWYGLKYEGTVPIDAENNWWGDASGPTHVSNPTGTGDKVSSTGLTSYFVDYTPWLDAPYAEPVTPVTTISLESGWNFISVPKRMAASKDTFGELLAGIDVEVAYSYDPDTGLFPLLTNDSPVEVLEGYWIDVNTAGTVALSYLQQGQTVPPSKQLKGDAWNAIGPSSTTSQTAANVLKSIEGSWSTLIGWDAEGQAYEDAIIAPGAENMTPGKGYWIWMTQEDVLSAISG